jgi:hypothetical protein
LPTGVAVQPGCAVLAVSTAKPAGGEMFAEPRVVLLDASFARVIVKFCGLTGPLVGFVTATCTVKFFFEGAAWAEATATTAASSPPKTSTAAAFLREPSRFMILLPPQYP